MNYLRTCKAVCCWNLLVKQKGVLLLLLIFVSSLATFTFVITVQSPSWQREPGRREYRQADRILQPPKPPSASPSIPSGKPENNVKENAGHGSDEGTWNEPLPLKEFDEIKSIANPDKSLRVECSKCALVSSSGQLLGSKVGHLIDSFPCVIRMNLAPTRGFEEDVGIKTTIRFTSWIGLRTILSLAEELLEGIRRPDNVVAWGPPWFIDPEKKTLKQIAENYTDAFYLSENFVSMACSMYDNETGINRKQTQSWPSTGWVTMQLARHICREINVFGMVPEDYCKTHPNSTAPYHYFEPRWPPECRIYNESRDMSQAGHRFETEKKVFANWSKLKPRIFFHHPEWNV